MSLFKTTFSKDILLDEEAFNKASEGLSELAEKMRTLKTDISNQLENLKEGFDTAAGDKFFRACGNKLLQPMEDQCLVIEHVSLNLRTAKNSYDSVFSEYEELNTSINNM